MTVETCAGSDEAVERDRAELAHLRRLQDVGDRRRGQHVVAEHAEIGQRERVRLPDRSAVGGVVVSKPMAKNTTSRAGFSCARRSASAPSTPSECRRRAPSPSSATDPSTPARASCRRRCTGSAPGARRARSRCRCARSAARTPGSRARGSSARWRQQVLQAVTRNRMGVAAAEFHQAVRPVGLAPRARSRAASCRASPPSRNSSMYFMRRLPARAPLRRTARACARLPRGRASSARSRRER